MSTVKVGILFVSSPLHDSTKTLQIENHFLAACQSRFACARVDESRISSCDYLIVLIMTGGTENSFLKLWPVLKKSAKPFLLAATEADNSLPAALEILTWINQNFPRSGVNILHGDLNILAEKIHGISEILKVNASLQEQVAGIIGTPSDWLIGSMPELSAIEKKLGMKFVSISMPEFKKFVDKADESALSDFSRTFYRPSEKSKTAELVKAAKVYAGLIKTIKHHSLTALTLRCFDILASDKTTGCLALAKLNDDGIPAACEGDVPAMLTMIITRLVTGKACFMANPSRVHGDEITLAHCTCPSTILRQYALDSHFESGIGLAISGEFAPGAFTLFKLDFAGNRYALASGQMLPHQHSLSLCRTQIKLKITGAEDYFLRNPLGNHHLLIPGDCTAALAGWCKFMQIQPVWN